MFNIYPVDFPFQPHFVQLGRYRLAYFDEGMGRQTLLLLHGNPVSAYVYYRLMRLLLPEVRCVAPDLLGFGLSDKPSAVADYSLRQHIDLVTGLVQTLDLREVVLVGHDWGGPIGWGAAVQAPERYTHLIILNTLTEAPMTISPVYRLPFHLFRRTPRLFDYLVRQHNLFQKMGTAVMAEADRQVFSRANHSPETRAGIAAFPRMIPHNSSHSNYPILQELLNRVAGWDIPALVLFSDHDSVFTAEQGKHFARQLKQAQFKLVAGPRHFLQYEAPTQIAREILEFLRDNEVRRTSKVRRT